MAVSVSRALLASAADKRVIPAGDPNDALERIVRPKLPAARVTVSEVPGLKLSQSKQRELLPVITKGIAAVRDGKVCVIDMRVEPGYDAD